MPLPKDSELFLDVVLPKSRIGTLIHLYDHVLEYNFKLKEKNLIELCNNLGYEI